jgi:pyroglutamyl-peptidase
MPRPPILLTGFGPFPGASENVSKWLVETLAASLSPARLRREVLGEVLPTEWREVSRRGPDLLHRHKPGLVLHFGLNPRARGFRIERSAHNRLHAKPDARGALPEWSAIIEAGHARLDTPIPAKDLARHLHQSGLPAATSRSAGSYLCNFLYYLSLDWAAKQEAPCHVCFVHLPPGPSEGGPLTEAELLRGAEAALVYLLDAVDRRDGEDTPETVSGPALARREPAPL